MAKFSQNTPVFSDALIPSGLFDTLNGNYLTLINLKLPRQLEAGKTNGI